MSPTLWDTLYKLSLLYVRDKGLMTSTTKLAETTGLSQQTVSRHLIMLERLGLIERQVTVRGEEIKISEKGLEELRKVYYGLKAVIEGVPKTIIFEGKLFTGIREAAYYMGLKPYRDQFLRKLGFDPYPGTVNLKLLSVSDIRAKKELESFPGIEIESYRDKNRTYSSAKCFKARINDEVDGALIMVERTYYDASVLEVIAPVYLRERLKLKDGSTVRAEVFTRTD